jgi:hypothetical protein
VERVDPLLVLMDARGSVDPLLVLMGAGSVDPLLVLMTRGKRGSTSGPDDAWNALIRF